MDLYNIKTLAELKELLDLLREFEISEFVIEADDRKLKLSTGKPAPVAVASAPLAAAAPAPAAGAAADADEEALPPGTKVVTSPMVGTFYRAASPEADPFVDVGDRVREDATLCIVEAMKVMNEIPSGVSGVVKEILVTNGESIEFGQPLFHILAD